MSATRESIMVALFAQLSTLPGLTTKSRRNRAPEQIGQAASPALFLLEDSEEFQSRLPFPPIQKLKPKVIFYNDIGADPNAIPATAINNLIDALVTALQPQNPTNLYTLGGLVDSVEVEGEVRKAPGDITGKSVASLNLCIVIP